VSTKERWSNEQTGEAESPFLDEELFVGESEEEWEPRVAALAAESPFRRTFKAFEERPRSAIVPEVYEEETNEPEAEGFHGKEYEYERDSEEEHQVPHDRSEELEAEDFVGGFLKKFRVMDPFPSRFAELAAPQAKRDKLNLAFKMAIKGTSVDPSFIHMPPLAALDTIPLAIVALDADGARPLAGQHHFEMHYSGSLLKVAAMYAAHQLRVAVNNLAATLDVDLTATLDVRKKNLFKKIEDAFNPLIRNAVPRINNRRPLIADAMRVPKYKDIFVATMDTGHWRLDFNSVFDNHLNNMIVESNLNSSGFCIRALGYSWINGVLQSAGFFVPEANGMEGIWLAGDYHQWPTVNILSKNDGMAKQVTTCYDMAWLFVLLHDQMLVKNDISPPSPPATCRC
jgi:hypothetical protein